MSYNITTWKTKQLKNLVIPLDSFFVSPRKDWHPYKEYDENGDITLYFMESEIKGSVKDGLLNVSSIHISGEGSGTSLNEVIEPALKQSSGHLTASCVWEGGDSINQLIVTDGKVEWKNIEI